MIRFSLICVRAHEFEGWFASSDAFEHQKAQEDISCPVCGSLEVDKALMAPAVATSCRKDSMRVAAHVPDEAAALAMLKKIRKEVTENAEYVGSRFAEEARRIHYDEVQKRGIYGEATPDEARALAEEGIEFHALPLLPEDHN